MNQSTNMRYELEKEDGTRAPSGALRLKKLSGKHKLIACYHLQGMDGATIALRLDMDQARISLILNDPLTKAFIEQKLSGLDDEMKALYGKTIDAIRTGLTTPDPSIKLKAADIWLKANGKYGTTAPSGLGAEDLVQALLNQARDRPTTLVQVNVGREEREETPSPPTLSIVDFSEEK